MASATRRRREKVTDAGGQVLCGHAQANVAPALPEALGFSMLAAAAPTGVTSATLPAALERTRAIRVVHIVPNLAEGGAESMVRALCPRLRANGLAVTIVSIYPSRLDDGGKAALGVPVVEIGRTTRRDVHAYWRLYRALLALAPDVVHAHVHSGKYAGRLAAIAARVPHVIYTEHDSAPPRGGIYDVIDPILDRRTRRTIAFSEAHRSRLAKGGQHHAPIAIIPNGIDTTDDASVADRAVAREILDVPDGVRLVMVLGRLAPEKNVELALRAFEVARARSGVPMRLAFVGSGPLEAELRGLAVTLGLDDDVRFLGYRTDGRVLLAGADALLFPSRNEAMPLALFEAMHRHVPVVTTPWRGALEMTCGGRCAFLTSGWTAREVAHALERALETGPVRDATIERARNFARVFSIDRTAALHARLYEELMGR